MTSSPLGLPDGLELDAVTGMLAGNPSADSAGEWAVSFAVIDELSGETYALSDMVLTIHSPLVTEGIHLIKTVDVPFKGQCDISARRNAARF